MLISYSNYEECIVCTPEKEKTLIKDYFTFGGRNKEDYDRKEHNESIVSSINKNHISVN